MKNRQVPSIISDAASQTLLAQDEAPQFGMSTWKVRHAPENTAPLSERTEVEGELTRGLHERHCWALWPIALHRK